MPLACPRYTETGCALPLKEAHCRMGATPSISLAQISHLRDLLERLLP